MYDIAVIGGGPAGYTAALEAVRLGRSVILFEDRQLGGTCLNRGCVPTKFLLHTAETYSQMLGAERYGILISNLKLDYSHTCTQSKAVVNRLREGLELLLEQSRITIVSSTAEIVDAMHVSACGEMYEVRAIVIAAGSDPALVYTKGAVTSDELLNLDKLPRSLKIIGGGVTAVEFAYIFAALGSSVKVCIRGDRILRKWDREISVGLSQILKKKGVQIFTKCSPEELAECDADITFSAVGRVPRTIIAPQGLYDIGSDGGIVTDTLGRTKTEGIYACGDVVSGSVQLAHVAMEQARRAVRDICGKEQSDHPCAVVNCIYTVPEAVSVGMTEAAAKSEGIDVTAAKQTLSSNARTLISTNERGFIKLVAERESGRLLGAQLLCERACEIGSELALAINSGLTVKQLADSTRPHPSFCEAVTEAAEAWLLKRGVI